MDKVRSSVTNFFGNVPLSYTRFSLTPQTDGDASQVEMKLADEEECGDHTVVEVMKHRKENGDCKRICFKVLGVTLIFLIGFLIGYLSYRGRAEASKMPNDEDDAYPAADETIVSVDSDAVPEMSTAFHWGDLRDLLENKAKNLPFKDNIRKLSETPREAGSSNEESMALMMHDLFTEMGLDKVWNDEHYVKLQDAGSSQNKVTILKNDGKEDAINPTAFVAYSPSTSIVGNLVYAHYGRTEDFKKLQSLNIKVSGSLVLVRSGLISFCEKVENAVLSKAIGVLIYPEPSDFTFPGAQIKNIESPFGHAHYGTGDPYTPGFPSFNHTQFPPSESSGLPKIPVQTISSDDGNRLLGMLSGVNCPSDWKVQCMLGPQIKDAKSVKLDVTNVLAEKKIYNVFGVLRGFDEPERYVIVGAQRDAWGPGVAKAAVGSSILLGLAQMMSDMVKNEGFKPKRSIIFASWGAGEFGSVGATEWLEGYLTTLHMKAIAYINLDSAVQGSGTMQISASPLMFSVIGEALKEIDDPDGPATLHDQFNKAAKWTDNFVSFSMEDAAYPFLAYSGIPSVSFSFQKNKKSYAYLGTQMDTLDNFENLVDVRQMCRTATQFAGQLVLRLTHEDRLLLDVKIYSDVLLQVTMALFQQFRALKERGIDVKWTSSARGDFNRAAASLIQDFTISDLSNKPQLRSLNDRVMKVEHDFLSPYVSPKEAPFRHIFYGLGKHTSAALMEHLQLLQTNESLFDQDLFKNQLALFTWTVQGAANSLSGEIWDIDNEF
ncbi:transferrin receptor protein 1 [Pelodytes ibericus]